MAAAAGGGDPPPIAAAIGVVPGDTQEGIPPLLAAVLRPEPGWHFYWENPGAGGLPTVLEVQPANPLALGPVRYPPPLDFPVPGGGTARGYSTDRALVAAIGSGAPSGTAYQVRATVRWLACRETCVPGEATASVDLAAPGWSALGEEGRLARATWREAPAAAVDTPGVEVQALRDGGQEGLVIRWRDAVGCRFLPYRAWEFALESVPGGGEGQVRLRWAGTPRARPGGPVGIAGCSVSGQQRWVEVAAPGG